MSAIPKPASRSESCGAINAAFLRFLPAVKTHAKVQFRHLPAADREDAIADATAAAFLNFRSASQRGRAHKLTPSTVATYAVLHARTGRHVGGCDENTFDVLSRRAQMMRGFEVHHLPNENKHSFDCLRAPDQSVWRQTLLHDRRTPVPD
jgi:hypothetical protein